MVGLLPATGAITLGKAKHLMSRQMSIRLHCKMSFVQNNWIRWKFYTLAGSNTLSAFFSITQKSMSARIFFLFSVCDKKKTIDWIFAFANRTLQFRFFLFNKLLLFTVRMLFVTERISIDKKMKLWCPKKKMDGSNSPKSKSSKRKIFIYESLRLQKLLIPKIHVLFIFQRHQIIKEHLQLPFSETISTYCAWFPIGAIWVIGKWWTKAQMLLAPSMKPPFLPEK